MDCLAAAGAAALMGDGAVVIVPIFAIVGEGGISVVVVVVGAGVLILH